MPLFHPVRPTDLSPVITGLRRWLAVPAFENPHKTAIARLLNKMILALVGMWGTAELILLVTGNSGPPTNLLLAAGAILLMLAMREWLRRGHVGSVGYALPLLGWLAVTAQLYNIGTIITAHLVAYMVILMIAALVHGPVKGALFCVLPVLSVFGLALAGQQGLLPHPQALSLQHEVFTFLQNTIITFALVLIARGDMMRAVTVAQEQVKQRRAAEKALRTMNTTLDQRITERTQALEDAVELQKQSVIALRDSEALFRSMFENSPFAYQSLDDQGRFAYVNTNLCDMLGYPRDQLIGRPFSDFWLPEDRGHFPECFCTLLEQGSMSVDLRLVHHSGEVITVFLQGRVQYDDQGRFERTHCVLYNVTERQAILARLERQNRALSELHLSTIQFLKHRDLKVLFQALVDHATLLLDASYGQMVTLENGERLVVQAYTANHDYLANTSCGREDAHLAWRAIDTLQPAVVENYSTWERRRSIYEQTKMYAAAQLPIISGDGQQCLGVVGLGRDKPGYPFSEDQIQVGKLFAQIAALVIENARLQSTLTEQSIRDPLTGLHNRRYLFDALQRELARSDREHYPITFMLLDIDLFKRINDFNGHGAGDVALCALSDQLASMVRGGDILCRYGGDELIIVMYCTPGETGLARAEQIRRAVEDARTRYQGEELSMTISIGIAVYPDHGLTADEVISCADKSLYESKFGGRNKVTLYDPQLHANLPPIRISPQE